jgi:hypothetical protein
MSPPAAFGRDGQFVVGGDHFDPGILPSFTIYSHMLYVYRAMVGLLCLSLVNKFQPN